LSNALRSPVALASGFMSHAHEQEPCDPSSFSIQVVNKSELDPLARWMWCCAAVYGPTMNHASGLFSNCPSKDFVKTALAEKGLVVLKDCLNSKRLQMYQPGHMVLLDETEQAIVVVIRGTSNIRDTLTDLVCEPLKLDGSLIVGETSAIAVHDGMWRAAQKVKAQLQETIEAELAKRPDFKLLLTGHSLGAGVATLLCLLWRREYKDRVQCIAFGPPPTLDVAAAQAAEKEGVTSIVLGEDLVPRLSLSSVTDLSLAVIKQAELAEHWWRGAQPAEALRPVGRLLHVQLGEKPDSIHVVQHNMFKMIRVHHMMLRDHLPGSYLHGLGLL